MKRNQIMLLVALIGTGATVAGLTTRQQREEIQDPNRDMPTITANIIQSDREGELTATTGRDICVTAINAPKEVLAGSQYNVDVTLKNIGTVAASGHSVTLYVDDQQYEKKTCSKQPVDSTQVVSFSLSMHTLKVDPVKIYAKATFSRDDNTANNVSDTITVTPALSKLAKITDLSYQGDMDGVTLKWSEPAYKTDGSGAVLKGYNIWMNNEKVNAEPIESTQFVEPNPGFGNVYVVTAVYDKGESAASNAVQLKIGLKNGKGTKESPYTISNPSELKFFFSMADKDACEGLYFEQTADIDLNGEKMTLPLAANKFQGNYNGGSHALKNLNLVTGSQYSGLFADLGDKSVISNLILEGNAEVTQLYSAPLAGYCYGTLKGVTSKMNVVARQGYSSGIAAEVKAPAKFEDCEFSGKLTCNSWVYGGLAGRTNGGTFVNCKYTGEMEDLAANRVNVFSYLGGIAGYSYPSTYENCVSDGKFPTDSLGQYRGGIVGFSYATPTAANHGTFTYRNCVNRTPLKGLNYIAGISGYVAFLKYNTSNYIYKMYANLDSCVNYADIYSSGLSSHTGGIIGSYTHSTKVTDCDNYGNITSPTPNGLGGIAGGYMESPTDSTQSTFLRCRNFGKIESLDPANGGYYMGGIVGDVTTWTNILNSENHNSIIGSFDIGGIAGYGFFEHVKISGCVNYGDIKTAYYCGAGIIGFSYNETNEVSNCINYGAVSSESTQGGMYVISGFGMSGISGFSSGTLENNLNAGSVSGTSYVGGIVGITKAGFVKVANCLNTGNIVGKVFREDKNMVVASLDTVGAIIGVPIDGSNPYWNPDTAVQVNNHYTPAALSEFKDIPESYLNKYAGSETDELELIKSGKLGNGWSAYDKYCMPLPEGAPDSDYTKVWAAKVVPGVETDKLPKLSGDFFVGAPAGLTWTTQSDKITINGNNAAVAGGTLEDIVLTAKCGDASKEIRLSIDKAMSVEDLEADAVEVVEETWYDLNGYRVSRPAAVDGKAYVVVRLYGNGAIKAAKVLNVK